MITFVWKIRITRSKKRKNDYNNFASQWKDDENFVIMFYVAVVAHTDD